MIENINALANKACKTNRRSRKENPAFPIAMVYALITGWNLCLAIEEESDMQMNQKLQDYRLNLNLDWDSQLKICPILNASLEEDLHLLLDYEKNQNLSTSPKILTFEKGDAAVNNLKNKLLK